MDMATTFTMVSMAIMSTQSTHILQKVHLRVGIPFSYAAFAALNQYKNSTESVGDRKMRAHHQQLH